MNLDDIAKKAGVSRATVSRVINNKAYVNDVTRRRVMEVIEREGFTPNPAARMLVTRQTRTIGIVIPYMPSGIFDEARYFSALLQGITQVTQERDYSVLLWLGQSNDSKNEFYKRISQSRMVDGVLLTSIPADDPLQRRLLDNKVPFVLAERSVSFPDETSYVTIDNISAMHDVLNHLVGLGRRRIGTITGSMNHPDGQERLEGFKQALAANGLAFCPELVVEGDFGLECGYKGMMKLLEQDVDAVFAGSDITAVGALQAINEAGKRVPEDIALIGFDDLPTAVSVVPQITTMRQPIAQKGAEATTLLLDMIEGKLKEPRHIILPTELVVRGSTVAAK